MKKLKCLLIIIIMLLVGGCDFNNLSTSINSAVDKNKDNLVIHYIDQTTPNMIQRLNDIIERKPLISIGI